MNKTTNCNIKDMNQGDTYCGRGRGKFNDTQKCEPKDSGYWGNPFSIGKKCELCKTVHKDGEDTLPCYQNYLETRLDNDSVFKEEFYKLKGKRLVCFCKPKPCHTDVMIKFLDTKKK